ncbi:MAG: hypothetical protein E7C11_17040, partial [Klebsiella michiganensis]|nr:hypothetical protein [Klebsiella michiganensis]
MTYKILLPQEIMAEGREYLESRGYQLINGSGMEEEDIIRDIVDCDGIIVRLSKMSDRVFEAAKKLKVVARHGAGYDTVDLASAKRHGVVVLNAPIAKEGANKRGNSSRLTQSFHFFMFEPIFSPVNA